MLRLNRESAPTSSSFGSEPHVRERTTAVADLELLEKRLLEVWGAVVGQPCDQQLFPMRNLGVHDFTEFDPATSELLDRGGRIFTLVPSSLAL